MTSLTAPSLTIETVDWERFLPTDPYRFDGPGYLYGVKCEHDIRVVSYSNQEGGAPMAPIPLKTSGKFSKTMCPSFIQRHDKGDMMGTPTRSKFLLTAVALLSFFIWATGASFADTTLTLEKAIHVTTAEGSDAVLEAGDYVVEPAQEWLRITLSGESPATALLVETQVGRHEEQLDEPLALVAEGETGDAYHVVLLLLNGKKYESIGSTSGLRTRGSRSFLSPSVLKAAAQNAKNGPDLKNLRLRPRIENTIFAPGSIGGVAPGILAPKGRLYIKGQRFGKQKGEFFLKVKASDFPEYPSGKVSLEDVQWTNDKINGRTPKGMTGPIHRANVKLYVRRADGAISNGFPRQFEVPVETRILKSTDPEVRLMTCSDRSTYDRCQTQDSTLNGFHSNASMASGSHNLDKFAIHLRDGWVFSRVKKFEKKISGNDGDYIKNLDPPLSIGKSSWVGYVKSMATSDDRVQYWVYIEAKRAKGAY